MKKYWYILFMFFSCCNWSIAQQAGSYERSADYTYKQLESNFCGNALSGERLDAFMERAKQKVDEFLDYMRIIQDENYDTEIKTYALEEARRLFDENAQIKGETNSSVKAFLEAVLNGDTSFTTNHNITVEESFKPSGEAMTGYGLVSEYSAIILLKDKNSYAGNVHSFKIVLKKVNKQFGYEKKSVWEVLLSDIEIEQ